LEITWPVVAINSAEHALQRRHSRRPRALWHGEVADLERHRSAGAFTGVPCLRHDTATGEASEEAALLVDDILCPRGVLPDRHARCCDTVPHDLHTLTHGLPRQWSKVVRTFDGVCHGTVLPTNRACPIAIVLLHRSSAPTAVLEASLYTTADGKQVGSFSLWLISSLGICLLFVLGPQHHNSAQVQQQLCLRIVVLIAERVHGVLVLHHETHHARCAP